ncbi:MAG: sigma 54-interacting transcriptional regulator [bacterium]|nr:sigma 54-interacting transcriptional regulator [bacterium]
MEGLIVKTKITPPKLGKNILKRQRLLDLLRTNLDKKLILISADAGYGKTTLISDLASEIEQHRRAWYTVDKGDTDLIVFMSYLVESIVQAYPNFGNKTKIVIKNIASVNVEMVIGTFINELLDTLKDELFVFIDDYQEVSESKLINNALNYLIEHQLPNLHLIISTRTYPPFQLAKLDAKQQLFTVKKEELKFTQEETQALFKDIYHTEVPEVELNKLEEYTKGWITALQFVSQELSYKKPDEVIDVYSKAGEKVFEYFGNEILQKLPEKLQSFLLKSSILESMEPELLNNLLGISNSAEMLDSLMKLNLFISITLGEKKVFKYHPLFRKFLIDQLNETLSKELIRDLYRKAARYFTQVDDIESAISYWLASEQWEEAAALIEKVAVDMIDKGKTDAVNSWINSLPADLRVNRPWLLAYKGRILYRWSEWDKAMYLLRKAEKLFTERNDKLGSCYALHWIGAITIIGGNIDKGLEIEKNALRLAPQKEYFLKANILNTIRGALQRQGKIKEAIKTLNKALSLCKKIEKPYLQAMLLHNLGVLYHYQGDFNREEEIYKDILKIYNKALLPWAGATYNNMAVISLEKGDSAQCEKLVERGIQICKDFNDQRGLVHAYTIMGEMLGETGKYEEAMRKYQQALTLNLRLKEKQKQVDCLEGIAKLYLLQGDFYRAEQYINKTLRFAKESGEDLLFAQVLLTKGKIEIALGVFKKAETILLSSLSIIKNIGVKYDLMQVYFWLSLLYLKKAVPREEQKLKHYMKLTLNLARKYEWEPFLIKNCRCELGWLVTAIKLKIEPRYAIFILSQIGSPAFDTLTSLFELKDESIQRWVIEGLVNIGDERALNWLEKLKSRPVGTLKENILLAINRLKEIEKPSKEVYEFKKEVEVKYKFENIVGTHPKMQELYNLLDKVIDTDTTVLITGETGTGKELVARTIHQNSKRKDKKFVAIACGALLETLLESELFGYVKGAFTGAISTKRGLFEEANGGTLFLDDVTNLTSGIQAKLLRVLEDKEIRPVGGVSSKKVDVRIITSTNKELEKEVNEGRFRSDLYYRLAVVKINLPPLRERKSDIPLLAQHFLKKYCVIHNKSIKGFQKEAMDLLLSYNWPGNIRELEHEIEQIVIFTNTNIVTKAMLSTKYFLLTTAKEQVIPLKGVVKGVSLKETKREAKKLAEIAYIRDALLRHGGNVTHAAKELGFSPRHLRRLINIHHIDKK